MKKVTILGGGTGSFVVLTGLKKHHINLAAVVAMMDSGGSTGKLKHQLGVLPPGDLRQCLVALSEAPELWRRLFMYRFDTGDFKGHNFGNVMISALQKVCENYGDALDELHYLMQCVGRVYPAALTNADIVVTYDTGRVIDSETLLDEVNPDGGRIIEAHAHPATPANPESIMRIRESDYLIMGPGDLYSSIISIGLSEGIRDAVQQSKGTFIYVVNLMTKASQTLGYGAYQHIADLARYFGRQPDICIVNTKDITPEMAARYAQIGEVQVVDDLLARGYTGQIHALDLLDDVVYEPIAGQSTAAFAHSIVRHDPLKLERILVSLIQP